jgi:hypothetical protein
MSLLFCCGGDEADAEHMGANLLPWNAAGPVASPDIPTGTTMTSLAQFDRDLERIILELALRIVALS